MGFCDICGKQGITRAVFIEGAELQACYKCYKEDSKKEKVEIKSDVKQEKSKEVREIEQIIIENWPEEIKRGMNAINIEEKELAKKIGISESYMRHILKGEIKPDIKTAKKIEHVLKIKLIEHVIIEGNKSEEKIGNKTLADNIDWESANNGG
ncbi:MAG: helix-turn-helix domain-containing protein [Candidatus Anstonellales archaeon]